MTEQREPMDSELMSLLTLDGGPGPAALVSDAHARAMVGAVLERWQGGAPPTGGASKAMVAGKLLAVALVVGVGSAAVWSRIHPLRAEMPTVTQPASTPAVAPAPQREPAADVQAPAATDAPARVAIEPTVIESEKPRSADDLLRKANALRSRRQWRDALSMYEQVRELSPQSDAAYVATLAVASLRLEQFHDAKHALGLYRLALRRHNAGSLSEEAYYGVAECYRKLGRSRDELRALRTFVQKHPGSPLASQAQARIDSLASTAR